MTPSSQETSPDSLTAGFIRWLERDGSSNRLTTYTRTVLKLFYLLIREFRDNDLSLRSAALTYTVLLSMVPMLALTTAIVKGLGGGDQLRSAAFEYLATLDDSARDLPRFVRTAPVMRPEKAAGSLKSVMPAELPEKSTDTPTLDPETQATPPLPQDDSAQHTIVRDESTSQEPKGGEDQAELSGSNGLRGLSGYLYEALDKLFDYVERTNFAAIGSLGVIGLIISVIVVFSNIEKAMNAIWKVKSGRTLWRTLVDYLALLIFIPLAINIGFTATTMLHSPELARTFSVLVPVDWLRPLLKPVPVLVITLTFYAMYVFFPNTRVQRSAAISGSLLAAICWFTVQNLYISLQVGVTRYNAIYGSFATVPLFMAWIYLGFLFILSGAQITFVFQNFRRYHLGTEEFAPALRLSCGFEMLQDVYERFQEARPLYRRTLSEQLPHYPLPLIEQVCDKLISSELLCQSVSDHRLLPTTDERSFDSGKLVTAFFGETEHPQASRILNAALLEARQKNIPDAARANTENIPADQEPAGRHS